MDVSKGAVRVLVLLLLLGLSSRAEHAARPNIIVVVCDDLGWGDVSFHGSEQIRTPNMDVLAADGIVLDSYYVSPLCTPSRATLLSGRHPIHTGMQHDVIYSAMPYAFPLQFKMMSDHLKTLGYETHAVGKWHLGHMTRNHTPTMRGFDSFYGYYSGHHGYTDHSCFEEYMSDPKEKWTGWGLDLWDNLKADWSKSGKYTTELFTEKAIELLKNRDRSKPFFLYLSHLAVHVGNFYALFEAPEKYVQMNSHIKNPKRRDFAAMLSALDDAIGQLVEALNATDAIQNTILALTTDNGGAAGGIDNSAGSNWPLRGTKATHWEGGVRGTAFLWSPTIREPRVYRQLMHVSDWLPTLYTAAGGDVKDLGDIDGIDMWRSLVTGAGVPRTEVLHNIDPVWNMSALRFGRYKYVNGTYGEGHFDGWYQPAEVSDLPLEPAGNDRTSGDMYGPRYSYDSYAYDHGNNETEWFYRSVVMPTRPPPSPGTRNALDWTCPAARTIRSLGRSLARHSPDKLRTDCGQGRTKECKPLEKPCLFDIDQDPCEMNNIAEENPQIMKIAETRLADYRRTMVPPLNKPPTQRSDPRYFNYTWAPYMDSNSYDVPSPQTPLAM